MTTAKELIEQVIGDSPDRYYSDGSVDLEVLASENNGVLTSASLEIPEFLFSSMEDAQRFTDIAVDAGHYSELGPRRAVGGWVVAIRPITVSRPYASDTEKTFILSKPGTEIDYD